MPIIRGDLHFVFEIETRVALGGFSSYETYGWNCNSSLWRLLHDALTPVNCILLDMSACNEKLSS